MEPPIDDYQVSTAKWLIKVMIINCLRFPQPVILAALRQTLADLEQEAIATSR